MLTIPYVAQVPGYVLAQPLPVADVELHCYVTRRIRHHHGNGNRETITLLEALLADSEKNKDAALYTLLNTHEPFVMQLINRVCDELEGVNCRAPEVGHVQA